VLTQRGPLVSFSGGRVSSGGDTWVSRVRALAAAVRRIDSGGAGMGRERFAADLLSWEWRGQQLVAEISRCRYFCRAHGREVLAWCELRDVSGGRRCDIGSFRDVAAAKAACEADAARRVRAGDPRLRGDEERGPVDVRIARGRRASGAALCRYRQ
jgi:hypothetical protein